MEAADMAKTRPAILLRIFISREAIQVDVPRDSLGVFESKRGVPVHHGLYLLVLLEKALEHGILDPPVRTGFSQDFHLIAKEGSSKEVSIRILSGLPDCNYKFRRLAVNYFVLSVLSCTWNEAPAMPSARAHGFWQTFPCTIALL